MTSSIIHNIASIKQRMALACQNSGRPIDSVRLLLATKTVAADKILEAIKIGEALIGENKVQELKEKHNDLSVVPHQTHFIGHLQTNKIRNVIQYAGCIQSIDRLRLAEKLQRRLEYEDQSIDVFLQVNTSYESSKFGMAPEHVLEMGQQVKQLDRIRIKGLMTIGLFSSETDKVRRCFKLLKTIQEQLLDKDIGVHELSMGMSGDLETAIEEGSTMVRVGTAIFGKRQYPDSYYWNEGKQDLG